VKGHIFIISLCLGIHCSKTTTTTRFWGPLTPFYPIDTCGARVLQRIHSNRLVFIVRLVFYNFAFPFLSCIECDDISYPYCWVHVVFTLVLSLCETPFVIGLSPLLIAWWFYALLFLDCLYF